MKLKSFIIFFATVVLCGMFLNFTPARAAMCSNAAGNCLIWHDTEIECTKLGGKYWSGTECAAPAPAPVPVPGSAPAGMIYCFCSDNVTDIKESNYSTAGTDFVSTCEAAPKCDPNSVTRTGPGGTKYHECHPFGGDAASKTVCDAAKVDWESQKMAAIKKFGGFVAGQQTGLLSKIMPSCALENEQGPESACRDVTIFVALGINIAGYLFGIVGALALLMFVYGGITLAISMGNPEKVKKGGEIIMYAVLGLVIVFGAYILVKFLGEALGVTSNLL